MQDGTINVPCPSCSQVNRIPLSRVDQTPRCGKCKSPLQLDRPHELTASTFDQVALQGDLPVLVDFWAPWCGPCRVVGPSIERLASSHRGRLQVAKVNTDQAQQLAQRFRISGIPTLIVFSGGKEVDRAVGALPPPQLQALAERHAH